MFVSYIVCGQQECEAFPEACLYLRLHYVCNLKCVQGYKLREERSRLVGVIGCDVVCLITLRAFLPPAQLSSRAAHHWRDIPQQHVTTPLSGTRHI